MRRWVHKLLDQLDIDWDSHKASNSSSTPPISEEKATLLYIVDVLNKNLFDLTNHQVRKTRETLDAFAKDLVHSQDEDLNSTLFKFRQFYSSYRIDEYSYIQNTFDDFKTIIWDFADQLAEDMSFEKNKDDELRGNLDSLREAVEADSVEELRAQSRAFINHYIDYQSRKDERRTKRLGKIRKDLKSVEAQLSQARQNMLVDHLTGANNRKSFDEKLKATVANYRDEGVVSNLIILDIDHFKNINDSYGHDIGDFVIQECVKLLQGCFSDEKDFVARIGGEEFAIIVPKMDIKMVHARAIQALERVRKETFILGSHQIKFTMSMGIAQLNPGEAQEGWLKRADQALYRSKNSGRNQVNLAG